MNLFWKFLAAIALLISYLAIFQWGLYFGGQENQATLRDCIDARREDKAILEMAKKSFGKCAALNIYMRDPTTPPLWESYCSPRPTLATKSKTCKNCGGEP